MYYKYQNISQMSFSKQSLKNRISKPAQCFLALTFSVFPFTAAADEFDTLHFYASVNRAYDDNLFRVRTNEQSEQITTSTAGAKLDKKYSLQRFIIDVAYVDYKYRSNDFLDFDTINYDAVWQWALTPSLTGNLSTSRNKTLNGFGDFRVFSQNIRTTEISQFRAEYSPYKVWALIAGVTETSVDNSQTFNAIAQYEATAFDYGARYTFASGSNLSILGHKRDGQFQRPLNQLSLFDNGFTEDELEFDFISKPTGKSNLSSKLAYLSRDYDNFTIRNYDVWVGFLKYDLFVTGKIVANFDVARIANPFETNYSTYSVSDSIGGGLSYLFSEKISFALNTKFSQRDFKQNVVPGTPKREDDEQSISASVSWKPTKNIGLTLSSIKSSRNSTSAYKNFEYDDQTTSVIIDLKI